MIIVKREEHEWPNQHETFVQNVSILYDLANRNTGKPWEDYNDATVGLQGLIKEAIDKSLSIRTIGGGWSWTRVAATDGIMLNTRPLSITFTVKPEDISGYAHKAEDLYYSQCGASVKSLNDKLKAHNRSLKTSGASNGQTIAGALSTGTHGAAIDVGAIPDFVVGIHLIVSPTRHVWLERKGYPVVSDAFVSRMGAERVSDDDLFNAALVSFGSFGIIHGLMLETVPLFLYECYRLRVPLNAELYELMTSLDFNAALPSLKLPHGNERPYHFQTLINQYDKSGLGYMTIMYKRDINDPNNQPAPAPAPGTSAGDDTPAFIGGVTQTIPFLIPLAVNTMIAQSYKPFNNQWGTHGTIFFNSDLHGKVMSTAMGIPLQYVNEARSAFLELIDDWGKVAGVLAFRYVEGTKATLGFTRFSKTCIVELDCVFSKRSNNFYTAFWNKLREKNIPFTFHWGKMLELDQTSIRKMYGDAAINSWLVARKALMQDVLSMKAFTNDLMRQWGLDVIVTAGEIVT